MPAETDGFNVDDYIPMEQAPAHIPGRPHRSGPYRWSLRGLIVCGEIVRLKTIMVGGRRFTTRAWIADFLARCNGEVAPAVSPGRRQRQGEAAMSTLADMGVGRAAEGRRSV